MTRKSRPRRSGCYCKWWKWAGNAKAAQSRQQRRADDAWHDAALAEQMLPAGWDSLRRFTDA